MVIDLFNVCMRPIIRNKIILVMLRRGVKD